MLPHTMFEPALMLHISTTKSFLWTMNIGQCKIAKSEIFWRVLFEILTAKSLTTGSAQISPQFCVVIYTAVHQPLKGRAKILFLFYGNNLVQCLNNNFQWSDSFVLLCSISSAWCWVMSLAGSFFKVEKKYYLKCMISIWLQYFISHLYEYEYVQQARKFVVCEIFCRISGIGYLLSS